MKNERESTVNKKEQTSVENRRQKVHLMLTYFTNLEVRRLQAVIEGFSTNYLTFLSHEVFLNQCFIG